jgi:hypothetical protein
MLALLLPCTAPAQELQTPASKIFPLSGTPSCAVLRVKYADGSVWQNPLSPEP